MEDDWTAQVPPLMDDVILSVRFPVPVRFLEQLTEVALHFDENARWESRGGMLVYFSPSWDESPSPGP